MKTHTKLSFYLNKVLDDYFITQEELAAWIAVSQPQVSRMLSGDTTLATFKKFYENFPITEIKEQ